MQAYIKFLKKSFKKDFVYKFDCIIGVINTIIMILIYVAIWKAIYGSKTSIDGTSLQVVVTNFVLALAISQAFNLNDFMVSEKIFDGTIIYDILRPVSFMGYLLSHNLGAILFKIITQVIPAIAVCSFIFEILPPSTIVLLIIALASLVLGFFIMFLISFMISCIAFWFHNVWSIATIKNVLISILAGVYIPLWYLPERIQEIIKYTPFDSIYYTPISIYLGRLTNDMILNMMLKQALWVGILYVISKTVYSSAIKKLVHQGG